MLIFSETGEFNTLEAVNLALTYMREPRIDDLALINTSFSAEMAYAGLLQKNRTMQLKGWWFNTSMPTLTPIASGPDAGKISIPATYSKVELHASERFNYNEMMLTVEIGDDGNRWLYNAATASFIWGNPVRLEVVSIKKFEQTPDVFRYVVALENASLSGQQVDEGIALSPFHQKAYEEAQSELMSAELQNTQVNNFTNIPQVR